MTESLTVVCVLDRLDVDLLHLHHRGHRSFRAFGIGAGDGLAHYRRDNLPRQTELILQPSALRFLASVRGQTRPKVIDLSLILAIDHERDRFAKLEMRSAI